MIGELIGNYRITRKLGEGGMGSVYEGTHEQLGRRVAIKVLTQGLWAEEENLGRFFNEARAANIIQHPGVVSIYEYGRTPNQDAYIVMEFLEGESLAARMFKPPQQPLPLRFVYYVTRQIAATLTAVHAKGIYHRDLKPENIMLCPDSELPFGERTKLVDFGIAKLTEAAGGQGPGLVRTRTGATIGTPQYMSPEQCAGHKEIDAKTDVYSLGVMLFEMLARQTPFAAESPAEIITMHLYEQPPALSAMVPDVHPDLDRLVSSMLKKFAAQRPSMEQVVEALEALAAGTASSASPDAAPSSARKEAPSVDPLAATQSASSSHEPIPLPAPPPAGMQRASAWVAAGALLLGLGIGGTGMVLVGSRSSKSAPSTSACPAPLLAPSAAPPATWSVQTHPAGASVIRKSDGAVLGVTPWKTDAPRTEGSSTVLLRRAGYADYEVTLAHGTSIYIDKQLTASAAGPSGVATPVAAGGPPARVAPGSQKRGRKNGSSLATKGIPDSKDSVPVISEPEEFKHGAKPRAGGT